MLPLSWVVLGFFAGVVASRLPRRSGEGIVPDISVGITGAVIGGWAFSMWGPSRLVADMLTGSVLPASIGAAVFLVVHVVVSRRFGKADA